MAKVHQRKRDVLVGLFVLVLTFALHYEQLGDFETFAASLDANWGYLVKKQVAPVAGWLLVQLTSLRANA